MRTASSVAFLLFVYLLYENLYEYSVSGKISDESFMV